MIYRYWICLLTIQDRRYKSFEGDAVSFEINPELSVKLNKLATDNGATLYMVLMAAYNVLLSRYTGQEDIIVGSPVAGRPHADLQGIIGMFINTLAIRNYPEGEKTFVQFLQEVRKMRFWLLKIRTTSLKNL